jgi:hypothetical protein
VAVLGLTAAVLSLGLAALLTWVGPREIEGDDVGTAAMIAYVAAGIAWWRLVFLDIRDHAGDPAADRRQRRWLRRGTLAWYVLAAVVLVITVVGYQGTDGDDGESGSAWLAIVFYLVLPAILTGLVALVGRVAAGWDPSRPAPR